MREMSPNVHGISDKHNVCVCVRARACVRANVRTYVRPSVRVTRL